MEGNNISAMLEVENKRMENRLQVLRQMMVAEKARRDIEWEEIELCDSTPFGEGAQCVHVDDHVIFADSTSLYLLSSDLKSWRRLQCQIPVYDFALTSYKHQLLAIGGRMYHPVESTGQSWIVTLENETLPSGIPPMPTPRYFASAITIESAGCIVVAGGLTDTSSVAIVEVFSGGEEWTTVQPLWKPEYRCRSILHDGSLYCYDHCHVNDFISCCTVESLLEASADPKSKLKEPQSLWKRIAICLRGCCLVSFGKRLVMLGERQGVFPWQLHSPPSMPSSGIVSSVLVSDIPYCWDKKVLYTLTTGQLLLLHPYGRKGFVGSLRMHPFNLEDTFSVCSLTQLEEAGIPVMTCLTKFSAVLKELVAPILDGPDIRWLHDAYGEDYVRVIAEIWSAKRSFRCPTWRSLLDLLQELNQDDLSHQIRDYICTANPLSTSESPGVTEDRKILPPPQGPLTQFRIGRLNLSS